MSHKCPACEADVPGVVTQATLEERINAQRAAKDGEIKLLRGQLESSADKAGRFDTTEAERVRLASQVATLTEGAGRRDQLVALGINDPTIHSTFGVLYDSAVAGLEGEARPTFDAWLGDAEAGARLNPVLAPLFVAPTTPSVPDPLAPGAPPVVFPPKDTTPRVETPGVDRKVDAGQLRRMLQGMTVDQVKAWQAEHGDKYGWGAPPPELPAS